MTINNIGTTHLENQDIVPKTPEIILSNSIWWENIKLDELKKQEEIQKSKEEIQVEIEKYFMFHQNEDIRFFIESYNAPKSWYERINMWYCFTQKFVNWRMLPQLSLSERNEIEATDEEGGKFTKKLVIDRKTNTMWLLVVSGLLNIDEVEYEDISKFNFQTEALFIYRKDWKNYLNIFEK